VNMKISVSGTGAHAGTVGLLNMHARCTQWAKCGVTLPAGALHQLPQWFVSTSNQYLYQLIVYKIVRWIFGLPAVKLYSVGVIYSFKGTVSRDGGWGKALEWWFSPKLRFANPFFCLKIRRLNATARRVADPSM
jgi:hypothetical protein